MIRLTSPAKSVAGVFVVLAMAGVLFNPGVTQGQSGKTPSSVVVANTTAQPVPTVAQGTTAVAGSVTITGTPTVTVSNTADTAVFVREPARDPLIHFMGNNWVFPWQPADYTAWLNYIVPAGQRAVITQLSCRSDAPVGTNMEFWFRIDPSAGPEGGAESRLPTPERSSLGLSPGRERVSVAQRTELYLGPGNVLWVWAFAESSDVTLACYINGYLVNAQ